MTDRNENRCCNTEALNKHLADEDRNAELLEEFQELAQPHLAIIEEQIFHINNKAEAFDDLDLEDEIDGMLTDVIFPTVPNNKIRDLKKLTKELKEVLKCL